MPRDPIKTLELLERNLDREVAQVLNKMAFKIRRRVASQEFLHWQSKRVPVVVEKARLVGDVITVMVRGASRWKWGHVHVGPPGVTTITAKDGMLAVPTDAARKNFRGRKVGPKHYAGTVIRGGVIWGKAGWGGPGISGFLRQRRAAGEKFKKHDRVALFILKKSVKVRRRIIPAELINWIEPQFRAALKQRALVI